MKIPKITPNRRSLGLLAAVLCLVSQPQAAPVLDVTFENRPDGYMYNFNDDGINTQGWSGNGMDKDGNHRAFIDDDMPGRTGSSKALRITYPKDRYGPGETGAQEPIIIPAAQEYYASYFLRFASDFSWGKGPNLGGKLPGLASQGLCSGGNWSCSGAGFTARYMWNGNPDGRATLYLYHQDKNRLYGDHLNLGFTFQAGVWHHVVQRVRQNTGSNSNGILEVWIDGVKRLTRSNLRFDGSVIDRFYFSTFLGGGSSSYELSNTGYIWFDDILVSTDPGDIPWDGSSSGGGGGTDCDTGTPGSQRLNIVAAIASSDDGNVAGSAIDNDLGTRWSSEGNGEWLRLQLGQQATVKDVTVAFYNGNQRSADFDIQVSSDGASWTTVGSFNSCGGTTSLEQFNVNNTSGSYVRFVGYGNTANGWNSITELNVYGTPISNNAPIAVIGSSSGYTGAMPFTVSVNGSGSSDPDGDSLSYSWDFADGGAASGVNASHTYTAQGYYSLMLTVNDGNGGMDTDSKLVQVNASAGGGGGDPLITGLSVESVTAEEIGNRADNLYDGSFGSSSGERWSAEDFPQNVVLDLGAEYEISQIAVFPYQDRAYQYTVALSTSPGSGFNLIVDRSGNSTSDGSLSDNVTPGNCGRYLRLEVTGAFGYSGNWASFIELQAYGTMANCGGSGGTGGGSTGGGGSGDLMLEAEDGTLSGVSTATNLSGYSGNSYIDASTFTSSGDSIEVIANVPSAGDYDIAIGYYNGASGAKHNDLVINNSATKDVYTPVSTSWQEVTISDVALNAGNNSLRLEKEWGWVNFDYIKVVGAGSGTSGGGGTTGGGPASLEVRYATTLNNTVEVRIGSPSGMIIATGSPGSTGGWNTYQTTTIPVSGTVTGVHDLYLTFSGSGSFANIDWFDFAPKSGSVGGDFGRVEAESFNSQSGGVTFWSTAIGSTDSGDWVKYDDVDFGQ